ncbi:MAG: hypothetical protein OEV43_00595 [Coriobacteriia bacterium]|nr:hypothetical protein [Coriobacteriia bacterium]
MSVRFTSGGVGRFGFDEANATLDAADAMVGRFGDYGKRQRIEIPRPIVARLTEDLGDQMFEPGTGNVTYRIWNWKQVQVGQGAKRKRIEIAERGKQATKFGDSPAGRAIQLGGTAAVGETVILFRMMAKDGTPLFCFSGRSAAIGAASLLAITGTSEIVPGMYRYEVAPQYINASGFLSPNPTQPIGVAFNVYELSGNHDQPLEFDDPPSRLRILGPVKGPVVGVLSSDPRGDVVWTFEAPSPLGPECIGPTPGTFGTLLNGGI